MKTLFKTYMVGLAMGTLCLTSCNESDFLTETNQNVKLDGSFWKTEADANKGLAAVYNLLAEKNYGYYSGFEGYTHLQMRSDDMYPTRGEEPKIWQVLSFTNTSDTYSIWDPLYKTIQLANVFIYNVEQVEMDAAQKAQMIAEATFIRGNCYFQLYCNFGRAVIHTQPTGLETGDAFIPLSSKEEVLAQAANDFAAAKNSLPETRSKEELGRITRGAAIAMLGKAYVWQGKFAEAKTEFESIMGKYDLMENYEDNFRDDHEFNKESIWEINYDNFGNEGDSWGSNIGGNAYMGNVLAHYFGPQLPQGGGWYKMQPSPWLVKEFISEPREAGADSRWDKRLYTNCFFKYSDYADSKADEKWFNGVAFDDFWSLNEEGKMKVHPAFPEIDGKAGRFLWKKFTCWWNEGGCTMYNNPKGRLNNFRIMRFAEVLLLHAEAALETGDINGADADLQRIRNRAGLPEKHFTNSTDAMKEIRHQNLLELAGECHRWFYLTRWYSYPELKALMQERKKDTYRYDDNGNIIDIIDTQNFQNFQEKHMYLPIPQSEINTNPMAEQNELWK